MRQEAEAAEWLRWLEQTDLATAVRESAWLYPTVEILHIVGFVVLVGAAVMFDLRLLGLSKAVPVTALARHLLPWSRLGLALAAPTGLLLFSADATELVKNPALRLKLALLGAALVNAGAFHRWTFRGVAGWDTGRPTPRAARLAGLLSLGLWGSVIACGRLIAYL
jgi:hypothetical protein